MNKSAILSLCTAFFIMLFCGCATKNHDRIIPGQDLQALINALPEGTNEVRLAPCVYSISSPIILPSNIRLVGHGVETIFRIEPGKPFPVITNEDHKNGNTEIVIESLTLDGFSSKQPNSDKDINTRVSLEKNTEKGNTGIYFNKVSGSIIKNVYFRDFRNEGAILSQCSSLKVIGNVFRNCSQKYSKRYLSAGALYLHHSDDCLISENSIKYCYEGGIFMGCNCNSNIIVYNKGELLSGGPGIYINQGTDNLIQNNAFLKTSLFNDKYDAVIIINGRTKLKTENGKTLRNIILSNLVQETGRNGIGIHHADETRIIRNIVKQAGISRHRKDAAIYVDNSQRSLIQNNLIQNNDCNGIKVVKSNDVRLLFNRILDNTGNPMVIDSKSQGVTEKLNDKKSK